MSILPTKVIPLAQQLNNSYCQMKIVIELGFNNSSEIISQFVIKSYRLIQHGMREKDQKTLVAFGNQLMNFFTDEFASFVEFAMKELVDIQSELLVEATSGKVQAMLDKRKTLEQELLRLSALLRNKSSEHRFNQGIIDTLQLGTLLKQIGSGMRRKPSANMTAESSKTLSSGISERLAAAKERLKSRKDQLKERINNFRSRLRKTRSQKSTESNFESIPSNTGINFNKWTDKTEDPVADGTNETPQHNMNQDTDDFVESGRTIGDHVSDEVEAKKQTIRSAASKFQQQVQAYTKKIEQRRTQGTEQQGSLWMLLWKVNDVSAQNDDKDMQENIGKLKGTINFLKDLSRKGSILDLAQALLTGKKAGTFYQSRQNRLEQERQELQDRYNRTLKTFNALVKEIEELYRSSGANNLESFKMIDELCRAIQDAHVSIVSAYGIMRTHITSIDADPDLVVTSVLYALTVLNMIDSYLNTMEIEQIKQVLGLE